jgi:hypothetical protein
MYIGLLWMKKVGATNCAKLSIENKKFGVFSTCPFRTIKLTGSALPLLEYQNTLTGVKELT